MQKEYGNPVYHCVNSLDFDYSNINSAAIQAVTELNNAGYETYLVGGCVRDLLLEVKPKDFDISTSATPRQIQSVFKRSRIIGQRFKIVHVTIRGELLEISTFRQEVKSHHKDRITGQVLDDNVFGTLDDDASRRDFTVNALYYCVKTKRVIDFFNAIEDIKNRKLRLIGDPQVRFAEDPGRILRAVRFQAKFDFKVSDGLIDAIFCQKHLLNNIPPARRFDEVLKLFYCGKASIVWKLLNQYELLPYLFADFNDKDSKQAEISKAITTAALRNTDLRITQDKPVISAFMFCAILWPYYHVRFKALMRKKYDPQEAMTQASEEVIARQLVQTGMLRRVSNTIREIWWMQFRLEKQQRKNSTKILAHPRFRAAYDFLLIRAEKSDADQETADFWTKLQNDPSVTKNLATKRPPQKRHYMRKKSGNG